MKILFITLITALFFVSCSSGPSCITITTPKIRLTGDKTAIENQIVGEYREVEKDTWLISSVNNSIQNSHSSKDSKIGDKTLLLNMKIRELHESEIKKYKNEGAIGERNNGLIKYMKTFKYEHNGNEKKLLLNTIKIENEARENIFKRVLFLKLQKEASKKEISIFAEKFAEEQRALANKNNWIQKKNGTWVKK